MSDQNIYNAPNSEISPQIGDDRLLSFSPEKIKSLYNHSRTVRVLVVLWGLGIALILIALLFGLFSGGDSPLGPLEILTCLILAIPTAFAMVGLHKRTGWGRILGIVMCFLNLLNFPLGTLIAIFGLIALFKSPELFGENKVSYAELKKYLGK